MLQKGIYTTVLKLKCSERLRRSPVTKSEAAVDATNR